MQNFLTWAPYTYCKKNWMKNNVQIDFMDFFY